MQTRKEPAESGKVRGPSADGGDMAADDQWVARRFVGVTFRVALGLFPLLFSVNTVWLDPARPAWQVAVAAAALAVPAGVEFVASDRNVGALEEFVVGVLLFWLAATAARAGAGWLGATPGTVELVGIVLLAEGYVISYLLIYAGWGRRLRESLG
jgi:hypothetical protein